MHTKLRTSLNTLFTVACLSLPATSVSHADKPHHTGFTPAITTADEHYLLYEQLLCNCPSASGMSAENWHSNGAPQGQW